MWPPWKAERNIDEALKGAALDESPLLARALSKHMLQLCLHIHAFSQSL